MAYSTLCQRRAHEGRIMYEVGKKVAILAMVSTWVKNVKKGVQGENAVYNALRADNYVIVPLNVEEEGEITRKRKIQKRLDAENLTIPDAIAVKS